MRSAEQENQHWFGKSHSLSSLEPYFSGERLPKFGNNQNKGLESGDTLMIANGMPQMLDKNGGGGFAPARRSCRELLI
jgi:hypothetical protein